MTMVEVCRRLAAAVAVGVVGAGVLGGPGVAAAAWDPECVAMGTASPSSYQGPANVPPEERLGEGECFEVRARDSGGHMDRPSDGYRLLLAAYYELDPKAAAALREQALGSFVQAASETPDGSYELLEVGRVKLSTGTFTPDPLPFLVAFADDFSDAMHQLELAELWPEKAWWYREAAMAELDESVQELTTHTVIGD